VAAGDCHFQIGSGNFQQVMADVLQRIAGRPMLWHIIDRLAPQVDRIALSANGDPARFAMFGLPVLADTIQDYPGPLAGVLAGMEWASDLPGCTHVATVAGDTPFFPKALVARLVEGSEGSESRILHARSNSRDHPVFALWPVAMVHSLRTFLDSAESFRMTDFIGRMDHAAIDFPPIGSEAIDPFFNVNPPEDLLAAERLAAELSR